MPIYYSSHKELMCNYEYLPLIAATLSLGIVLDPYVLHYYTECPVTGCPWLNYMLLGSF
jgi:hypothetical protein